MTTPRKLPIKLGPRRLSQDSAFVDCPPVIDVHVGCEKEWSLNAGVPPKHNGILYAALIDTGAEATLVSAQLVRDIGAETNGRATIHGLTGTSSANRAGVQIYIPSQSIVFPSTATIADLGLAGQTFSVILGRSFLEHCRLEVDGPAQSYQLWWVG